MAVTRHPWLTSNELIESVKRKIALPISQNTFTNEDVLAFANEEMMISQVPSMLEYHEEYFVFIENVDLESNKTHYALPNRAIGMRLRDVSYVDQNNNIYDMTRINPDDKAYFQRSISPSNLLGAYYLQGNELVLTPNNIQNPTGKLQFSYFLRPNQLVPDDRAAIIQNFQKTVRVSIADLIVGDQLLVGSATFTAVASSPAADEFVIAGTDTQTATNLLNTINTNGIVTVEPTVPSSATIKLIYPQRNLNVAMGTPTQTGLIIQSTLGVIFNQVPDNIVNGSRVDFLQTLPGHRTYGFDVLVPTNGISDLVINFNENGVPNAVLVGDYVCSANECIIPQIPPDLHNGLAERTCGRILASLGDDAGLGNVNQKLAEIDKRQGNLLDQRIDGAPQKIVNRNGQLRQGKRRIGVW